MVHLYTDPVRIPVPGGKVIDEHIGAASTGEQQLSVAHMQAPADWSEPFRHQRSTSSPSCCAVP